MFSLEVISLDKSDLNQTEPTARPTQLWRKVMEVEIILLNLKLHFPCSSFWLKSLSCHKRLSWVCTLFNYEKRFYLQESN